MSCSRIHGTRWNQARLKFDTAAGAVLDDHLLEFNPVAGGVVTGQFLSLAAGNPPLPDTLTNGTCSPDGLRERITFTRQHAGGRVTTEYTGKVIPITGTTVVLITGRFKRTTVGDKRADVIETGDWETEKPT